MYSMVKILAIDLDGTLFYPKGRKHFISKKNLEFLRKFIDAGNKVVLVTSRIVSFCEEIVKLIDRDVDYICLTGAIIKANGKFIRDEAIPNEDLKHILDAVKHRYKPIGYFLTCKDQPLIVQPHIHIGPFLKKFYLGVYKSILGIYREEILISGEEFDKQVETGRLYNVKSFYGLGRKARKTNSEINKAIREKYPSIESSWMGIVLEFSPKGCSKGESLQYYVDYIKADKDQVYVIGDSGNDISMFIAFKDHSYCMSHAYPSVKKYAKYKVSRVYKLDQYLFERRTDE